MFLLLIQVLMFAALIPAQVAQGQATCDQGWLSRAELSFQNRANLRTRKQAEADLNQALESCTSLRARLPLERHLRVVQEEIAMTHLQIALFYRHADGVKLLQGALSRLRIVDEQYPRFSQMDRVLFMLGDLSDQNGSGHDATNYFRRVIAKYPRSSYARQARKRLAELAANGET